MVHFVKTYIAPAVYVLIALALMSAHSRVMTEVTKELIAQKTEQR